MGTDYVGQDGRTFHLNLSLHLFTYYLLKESGANLTHWSYFNDGDYVPETVCKEWARLIRESVPGLGIIKIPCPVWEIQIQKLQEETDNTIWFPRIWGKAPVVYECEELDHFLTLMIQTHPASLTGMPPGMPKGSRATLVVDSRSVLSFSPPRIDPSHAKFEGSPTKMAYLLEGFADFLETCGGCFQW